MRRVLELAGKAAGRTSPNPMVGAVIVKNGRVIAEGTPEEIQRNPEVIRAYLGHGAGKRGVDKREAGRA